MRQLKFRAWNGEQMVSPDYITRSGSVWWKENIIPTYSNNIMQFTGLYDCDGKEIWEGDILEYKRYYANIKWWSTVSEIPEIEKATEKQRQDFYIEKGIIRFNDGAFCLGYEPLSFFNIRNNVVTDKLVKGQNYNSDYEEKWWDFKLIGNIYENPELLNDTISNNQ